MSQCGGMARLRQCRKLRPGCHTGFKSFLFPAGQVFPEGMFFKIDVANTPEDSNYLAVAPVEEYTDECVGFLDCGGLDTTEWGDEACPAPLCTGGTLWSEEIPYPQAWTNLQILQFEQSCHCCGFKFMREACC